MYRVIKYSFLILVLFTLISCKDDEPSRSQIPQDGLSAYYKLDGDISDETGNNNGSLNLLIAEEDRKGEENKAFDFSSQGAYGSLGDVNHFQGEDKQFAISFWMKPRLALNNSTILAKLSQNVSCEENEQEFIVRVREGRIAPIFYNNSSNSYRGYRGNTQLLTNQWYHVILNYNGEIETGDGSDRIEIFLNGEPESFTLNESQGAFPFDIEDTKSHLGIGNRLNSIGEVCVDVPFQGTLDDILIYERLLSKEDVQILWEDNF